jgi:hypothetical protein
MKNAVRGPKELPTLLLARSLLLGVADRESSGSHIQSMLCWVKIDRTRSFKMSTNPGALVQAIAKIHHRKNL